MNLASCLRKGTAQRDHMVLMILLAVGILLILAAIFVPEFRDATIADQFINEELPHETFLSVNVTREWHERMDALRTPKFLIQDFGTGLFSLCAVLLALTKHQEISVYELLKNARSPRSIQHFLLMGSIAWGLAFASFIYLLCRDLNRHEFPSWSDSISIPMMGAGLFFTLLLPFVLVAEFAFVFKAPLPVGLWHWDQTRPIRSWSWSILFGACTFLQVFLLLSSLVDGDVFMMLASGMSIYLFLSARAAIIARSFSKP